MTADNNNDPDAPPSSSSIQEIEHDLTAIEQSLNNPRRGGRGVFASVNTMLSSLQSRLSTVHSSATTTLSERLHTAQVAHSHRIPLNVLSGANNSMQERRVSHLREKSVNNLLGGDDDDDEPGSRRRRYSRSSSLVASRRLINNLETSIANLHASGGALVVGSVLSPLSEQSKEEVEDDDSSSRKDDDAVDMKIEIPPLLSTASLRNLQQYSSHNIAGSIVPAAEESAAAVYSWGACSLHDDDETKSVEEARVSDKDRVGRLLEIVSIACGPHHLAVATKAGAVFTCGDNRLGAVDPTKKDVDQIIRPALVESLGNAIVHQVSCGWDHTAAVTSTGAVLTWGSNEQGQLGHYMSKNSDAPRTFCRPKVMSLGPGTRASSVACGNQFTMVLTTRMSMLVCGTLSGNDKDELASQLPALKGLPIASIAAGKDHAVAVTVFGMVYSWGSNVNGCCGRPFPKDLSSPVPMVTPKSGHVDTALGKVQVPRFVHDGTTIHVADEVAVVSAACGESHTVLVTRSGRLLVCGSNAEGQLGLPRADAVDHLQTVKHPDASRKFVCADTAKDSLLLLDDAGDVWQTQDASLVPVLADKNVITVAAGGSQYVALGGRGVHRQTSLSSNDDNADIPHTLESLIHQISNEDDVVGDVSAAGQELVNRLEELLKHPALLNSLFIEVEELDHLYQELAAIKNPKLRQALATATEKSILAGLDAMQDAQLRYPSSVRCILHYIRFFDRKDDAVFDARGTCISTLCETVLDLPFEGFKNLLAWISLYSPELLVRMLIKPLIGQLNRALHIDVDADGVEHQPLSRRAAPGIVGVLRWLYVASDNSGIAPEEFYCKAVSTISIETLYQDLSAKKTVDHKPHGVLLSENQFLIPPSTKRDMLLLESQVAMVKVVMQTAMQQQSATPGDSQDENVSIEPFYVLEVDRENLLKDTLKGIKEADSDNLRKKLRVKFKGEEGIDAGGVAKEFFQLVSEELFDINSGLWTRRFGEDITWFNSDCTWDEEGFELVGVLVGLALYNGVLLDVHFPQAVYRKLLDKPLGLEDVVDKELRNGLQQLLDYEGDGVEDIFCLTFEVTWMDLGKEQKVELKPNGGDIEVTRDNKEEYVLLYVKWLLVDSIEHQWDAFQKGVERIMQGSSMRSLFSPEELELLVVGTPELDLQALEDNATYEGGYDKNSAVVKNLWKFIKNADAETQMNFLKFSTGSCKAPIGGLGAMDFKIQRAGADSPQLPTSHTCFNTLLLPDYGDDYDKLKERLGRSILEYEGFGLE